MRRKRRGNRAAIGVVASASVALKFRAIMAGSRAGSLEIRGHEPDLRC